MADSDPNREVLKQLLKEMDDEFDSPSEEVEHFQFVYVKVVSALILADKAGFKKSLDEYVELLRRDGAGGISVNCLLNLKWTCAQWPRPDFCDMVQQKLDTLAN